MRRHAREGGSPSDVVFPVTPMLDMSFQLLAFFILTFQAPSGETRIDLLLPARAAALPGDAEAPRAAGTSDREDADVTNVEVNAASDGSGRLARLTLAGAEVESVEALRTRLERTVGLLDDRRVRVRLSADDALRYEDAARVISAIDRAGVAMVRLAGRASGGE